MQAVSPTSSLATSCAELGEPAERGGGVGLDYGADGQAVLLLSCGGDGEASCLALGRGDGGVKKSFHGLRVGLAGEAE